MVLVLSLADMAMLMFLLFQACKQSRSAVSIVSFRFSLQRAWGSCSLFRFFRLSTLAHDFNGPTLAHANAVRFVAHDPLFDLKFADPGLFSCISFSHAVISVA
eukprot:Rmarinus@m.15785